MFGKFFKRLTGGDQPSTMSADPFGRASTESPESLHSIARPEPSIVVQRDEILDGRSRIAGYRFAAVRLGSSATLLPDQALAALRHDNLAAVAERRLALIRLRPDDWFGASFAQFIGPNSHFFLATPPAGERDGWREALLSIKAGHGRIAIDEAAMTEFPIVPDLVLLDFHAFPLPAFERTVKALLARSPQPAIAVDGIGSWAEHRLCQSLGVRYSLGGFAASQDEQTQGERLSQSRLVLLEMLNLLRREGSPAELAEVAKRDPGVAVKVLGMANSPASGLASPVASIEQAMLVLGRETLYRWLSLAMFRAGPGGGHDEALLELALCRGRFLELLAPGSRPKQECDELFLVGMMSLLDSLFGMPMADIVKRMHLPQAVVDVLLRSDGPHGRLLMLALAMEKGRVEHAASMAATLNLDGQRLGDCLVASRAWADQALRTN